LIIGPPRGIWSFGQTAGARVDALARLLPGRSLLLIGMPFIILCRL
jgi:hypothetical protein